MTFTDKELEIILRWYRGDDVMIRDFSEDNMLANKIQEYLNAKK